MATIRPEYYVNLKGKQYPLYAGVLLAATEMGLQSLVTELIQIPGKSNDDTAIVKATAAFADGRTFTDLGDASPRNTSAQIATALVRMASTRAKGRVLRDAIGLGETLAEEIPDIHDNHNGSGALALAGKPGGKPPEAFCDKCGIELTPNQTKLSRAKYNANLCPSCQREAKCEAKREA